MTAMRLFSFRGFHIKNVLLTLILLGLMIFSLLGLIMDPLTWEAGRRILVSIFVRAWRIQKMKKDSRLIVHLASGILVTRLQAG